MPKISQKCEYGIRTLLELSQRFGEGPISVTEIADRQAVPRRFLELIVRELRTAGLVKSFRGAKGGYTLVGDPAKVTMGQIIRLLDGPLSPMDCLECGGERYCPLQGRCIYACVWQQAEKALNQVYDGITFQDLVEGKCRDARFGAEARA